MKQMRIVNEPCTPALLRRLVDEVRHLPSDTELALELSSDGRTLLGVAWDEREPQDIRAPT